MRLRMRIVWLSDIHLNFVEEFQLDLPLGGLQQNPGEIGELVAFPVLGFDFPGQLVIIQPMRRDANPHHSARFRISIKYRHFMPEADKVTGSG